MWPWKERDLSATVWLCGLLFFFFVLALSQIKKLSYTINLYQLVLMLTISFSTRKERGNNSLRHLLPNIWLDMVQRVCSPTLQEKVLSLNNTNPSYMILHLLFSVETTFILFSHQCFWATAAEEQGIEKVLPKCNTHKSIAVGAWEWLNAVHLKLVIVLNAPSLKGHFFVAAFTI